MITSPIKTIEPKTQDDLTEDHLSAFSFTCTLRVMDYNVDPESAVMKCCHTCVALNTIDISKEDLELMQGNAQIALHFYATATHWHVVMRSSEINVGALCEIFDGGGSKTFGSALFERLEDTVESKRFWSPDRKKYLWLSVF